MGDGSAFSPAIVGRRPPAVTTPPAPVVILHAFQSALGPGPGGVADAALLERFLADRDEAAFAALVRRHGPKVMAVCRRFTRHHQDAEDAFQAVFVVLARRASSVRPPGQVGSWLYGVACRTARKARGRAARLRRRETSPEPGVEPMTPPPVSHADAAVILEEVERLPPVYRAALVLCDLDGRPRKEAAAELGIPEGTLSSRLTEARNKLAARLARRGVTVPAVGVVLAGMVAADGAVPEPLTAAAVRLGVAVASGAAVEWSPALALASRAGGWWWAAGAGVTAVGVTLAVGALVAAGPSPGARAGKDPPPPQTSPEPPRAGVAARPPLHRSLEGHEWSLTALDYDRRTVSLSDPADRATPQVMLTKQGGLMPGGFSLADLPVASDAEVRIDDRPGEFARLSPGVCVRVVLAPDALRVVRIEATSPRPLAFVYTITAVDPNARTVDLELRGTGEKLTGVPVAADADITVWEATPAGDGVAPRGNRGTISSVRADQTAAVDLRVTPAGGVEICRLRAAK